MAETIKLDIDKDSAELERVISEIEALHDREGWPDALLFKVTLALEEMVLNVVTHGRHEGLHEIQLTVQSDEEAIRMELVDDGFPFDPLSDAPDPDLTSVIEDRRVGGLGVHLVIDMMDEIRYSRAGEKNHLFMTLLRPV